MLRWLGDEHQDTHLLGAAQRIEHAVEAVLAEGEAVPHDQGGTTRCTELTAAVRRRLQ